MSTLRHFTAFCCHDTQKLSSFMSSYKPQTIICCQFI